MTTSIRLTDDLQKRYKKLADSTGRSQSFYFTQALTAMIDQLEYEYSIISAAEKYRKGELAVVSLEEFGREIGLES